MREKFPFKETMPKLNVRGRSGGVKEGLGGEGIRIKFTSSSPFPKPSLILTLKQRTIAKESEF